MKFKEFVEAGYTIESEVRVVNRHKLMLGSMNDIYDTAGNESFINETYDDYINYTVFDPEGNMIEDEIRNIDELNDFITDMDNKIKIVKTDQYFKRSIDELMIQNEHGYTKEENLIYDEGITVIFFDDENSYKEEKEEFNKWLSDEDYEVKLLLRTINERIAAVLI